MLEELITINCDDNLDIVSGHLVTKCTDSIDFILRVSKLKEKFVPLQPGDYCVLPYPEYIEDKFDLDTLKELGLHPKSGYLYGKVINDDSWSSDYNMYSAKLKVNVLIHNEEKKLNYAEHVLDHLSLVKVDKESIKYFNRHGNN